MTIGERVEKAISDLFKKEYDNSLIQISTAIDGTGKKQFPHLKSSTSRSQAFLKNYERFIYWFASGRKLHIRGTSRILFTTELSGPEFHDWMYGVVRNGLLHEGDISEKVQFTDEYSFGTPDRKFLVSTHLIMGLILAIVGSPANSSEKVSSEISIIIDDREEMKVNDLWGKIEKICLLLGAPVDHEMILSLDSANP